MSTTASWRPSLQGFANLGLSMGFFGGLRISDFWGALLGLRPPETLGGVRLRVEGFIPLRIGGCRFGGFGALKSWSLESWA